MLRLHRYHRRDLRTGVGALRRRRFRRVRARSVHRAAAIPPTPATRATPARARTLSWVRATAAGGTRRSTLIREAAGIPCCVCRSVRWRV